MKKSFQFTPIMKVVVFALVSYAAGFLMAFIVGAPLPGDLALIPAFVPGILTIIYIIMLIDSNLERNSQIFVYSLLLGYLLWIGIFGYPRLIASEILPIYWEIGLPLFIFLLLFFGVKR